MSEAEAIVQKIAWTADKCRRAQKAYYAAGPATKRVRLIDARVAESELDKLLAAWRTTLIQPGLGL